MTRKLRSLLVQTLAVAPCVAFLLVSCDQKPPPKPAQKTEKKKASGSPDSHFVAGRAKIVEGHYQEAADELKEAGEDLKNRPILLDWIEFHEGMALLLAGKEADARPVFARIEERGQFPKGSNDPEMAGFLVKIAHVLRGADPAAADANMDYNKANFEGIAYLVLGLKDWDLEKYEDAQGFFRQFSEVLPEKQVDWADGPGDLQKLKDLAMNFVTDFEAFGPARKALDEAADKSIDDQHTAVELAQKARAQMKLTTKLSKSLDDTLAVMAPKVAAAMKAAADETAAEIAADEKTMKEAKEKRNDLTAKFQFAAAKSAIADANFKTAKARDEQELLTKKTSWLANYKDSLIEDLNKVGYTGPVKKKSGEVVPGKVTKADQQEITVGTVSVPWADLSLDTVYEIGASFINKDLAPEIIAFHQWHLGVFAFYAGRTKDAKDLLQQAAIARPVLKDELPIFENASGPY
jgi:tetratricopeptide (TPR) repeat protein